MTTISEYEAMMRKKQIIADSKRINYVTSGQWNNHNQSCLNCSFIDKPYKFCDESMKLFSNLAKSEWFTMPTATCLHCGSDWEEDDYGHIKQGYMLVCTNCGMKHEVEDVDYTMDVKLKVVGEFDPYYIEDH